MFEIILNLASFFVINYSTRKSIEKNEKVNMARLANSNAGFIFQKINFFEKKGQNKKKFVSNISFK